MSEEYKKCPFCGRTVPHADDCYFTLIDSGKFNARILSAWNRRAAPEWQSIDSAPKDGTNILLLNRAGNMATGFWLGARELMGWHLRGANGLPNTFFNGHHGPTHWMPLPGLPTGSHISLAVEEIVQ